MDKLTDSQLIQAYLRGDKSALELLIQKYLKPVYGFVFRYTNNSPHTEDITQETFMKVWHQLKKFDQTKNFKPWLFQIARNTAIDFLRKKKELPFSNFETEEGNPILDTLTDPEPLPSEIFDRENLSATVESAIQELTPDARAVMLLHYTEELTFQEIADILNESLNTVKSRHQRALIKLKDKFNAPN